MRPAYISAHMPRILTDAEKRETSGFNPQSQYFLFFDFFFNFYKIYYYPKQFIKYVFFIRIKY